MECQRLITEARERRDRLKGTESAIPEVQPLLSVITAKQNLAAAVPSAQQSTHPAVMHDRQLLLSMITSIKSWPLVAHDGLAAGRLLGLQCQPRSARVPAGPLHSTAGRQQGRTCRGLEERQPQGL